VVAEAVAVGQLPPKLRDAAINYEGWRRGSEAENRNEDNKILTESV
jgi:hypothetical protein